jgi:hypothetical protein
MPPSRGSAFSTAVWVIDWIHRDTAHGRPDPSPSFRTGFPQGSQIVLVIPDFSNHRFAFRMDFSHFSGTQSKRRVGTFLRDQLRAGAGASCKLSAFTGLQFDAMDLGADRNISDRHAISGFYRRQIAADHFCTDFQSFRRDHIPPFAVFIKNQCNVRSAIRIVFQPFYDTLNANFIASEVDDPITLLVSAARMSLGDPALIIASASLALFFDQRPIRLSLMQSVGMHPNQETGSGRSWFVLYY